MAPFRMPFTSKKPTTSAAGPVVSDDTYPQSGNHPYNKEKPSLALGLKERKVEPNEFKLSSVNDSGEYLPPSPYEKAGSFWGRTPSSTSTTHRSIFSENEPFSMSRESFDSYRRSFDISGRSPIIHAESFTSRTSLDSRRLPRPSLNGSTFEKPAVATVEDVGFEEVGLNDDPAKPKRKGFLSRFGDSSTSSSTTSEEPKSHHFHLLSGRKRGQSGTGNELGSMGNPQGRPASKGKSEVSVR